MLATSLPVAQWLERPTGVRKVMGSILVGDSDFSWSHARDMLIIQSFLIKNVVPNFVSNRAFCVVHMILFLLVY